MHKKALELLDGLSDKDKSTVENFFKNVYKQEKEHYWSITKLFYHAIYIPMFLQIGKKQMDKKRFSDLIYIDTHSGPGIAKIGADEKDVILGSPLLALYWPPIVAERVKQFNKIKEGFTKLYFIDRNHENTGILRRFTSNADNVEVITGDANSYLPRIEVPDGALVYMFVDPFGSFDSQLGYNALSSFVSERRVDIMMNILAPNIAQGLSSIKKEEQLLEKIKWLFGENFCESKFCERFGITRPICRLGSKTVADILRAYWCVFVRLGYRKIAIMPVMYKGLVLYYMVLAVKIPGKWVDGYNKYIHFNAPKDYRDLRALWLETTGRQTNLLSFMKD